MPTDLDEFYAAIRAERRDAARAGKAFAEACCTNNSAVFWAAVEGVSRTVDGWPRAFRAISRSASAPLSRGMRQAFLEMWVENKSIAQNFENHLELIDGLRALLPPYRGQAKRLYRAAFWRERRCRSYGLSWTTSRSIANKKFATDNRQYSPGGSCLLETIATPEAIIACVGDHYNEREYLVDRRLLTSVKLVERFPQLRMPERGRIG